MQWENKINKQRKIWIVDTTLRDGEQAPGVVFSTKERLEIAKLLARTGVDEIEAGIPAMGKTACKEIRSMVNLDLPCTLSSWCRAKKEDIKLAATCGTPGVHISFPVSSILLKTFDKNEAWVLSSLEELVLYAKKYFDLVSVGAQDATRTEPGFLKTFAQLSHQLGVHRLRIADTVGLLTPVMVMETIKRLLRAVPGLDLEFHGHNDLGMATANAVSAVDAGANAISVTVNGLGERAGNTPLEEVCMALFEVGGYSGNINPSNFAGLCRKVAAASGQKIPPSKPIIGENAFRHESGIHCAGLLKNPLSYQLFDPRIVGKGKSEYVIGYHSGRAAICHVLSKNGIVINKNEAGKLIDRVRKKAHAQKNHISAIELEKIYWNANLKKTCEG